MRMFFFMAIYAKSYSVIYIVSKFFVFSKFFYVMWVEFCASFSAFLARIIIALKNIFAPFFIFLTFSSRLIFVRFSYVSNPSSCIRFYSYLNSFFFWYRFTGTRLRTKRIFRQTVFSVLLSFFTAKLASFILIITRRANSFAFYRLKFISANFASNAAFSRCNFFHSARNAFLRLNTFVIMGYCWNLFTAYFAGLTAFLNTRFTNTPAASFSANFAVHHGVIFCHE